jgi:RNA polymerase sigma factor (sigma-70 family)
MIVQGKLETSGADEKVDVQLAGKRRIWEEFKKGVEEGSIALLSAEGAGDSFFEDSLVNWEKLLTWVLAKYGDREEVDDLLVQHRDDITSWLVRAGVARREDREELWQEVGVRVYKNRGRADGPQLYVHMAWLEKITQNVACDFHGGEKKRSVVQLAAEVDEESETGAGKTLDMLSKRENLRWSRESQETIEWRIDLNTVYARLTPRMQAILYMDLKGYTQKEIGAELGISQPTVNKLFKDVIDEIKSFFLKPSKGGQNDANATHPGEIR